MKIIIAILIFSIIVLFHELGHFLLAKKAGIRVNEFSIGLGPTVVGFTKGETKYSIKLLPFGGACMMEGEDEASTAEDSFQSKSVLARISVVAAGPIFNFIMAFLVGVILVACTGYDKPYVPKLVEGYPAKEAGLQEGDLIKKLNFKRIHLYREVSIYTFFHSDEPIDIVYERDGKSYETTVTPRYDEESGRYLFGFQGVGKKEKGNVIKTLQYGVYEVKYWIYSTLESLKMLVTGRVGLNDLSGPVGIVKGVSDTYEAGASVGWFSVFTGMLNWLILLSANLGVMNLLPLPALDGGRLVFLIIEGIRGKKVDPEKEGMFHFIGICLLMALMVLVMFNDIRRLF
ncbi:MAG: RIP metalloprotease RseP [Lachnospiraceae bacterium]|nr:RIP metalloprotease RseP [Lachnospiraceae bacterium]